MPTRRDRLCVLLLLSVALAGCPGGEPVVEPTIAEPPGSPAVEPGTPTEIDALAAVERFIEAFNSRDPDTFAATLVYPHVRPSANGGQRVFATAAEHAATTDYDRTLATGWVRSAYDSKRVVHRGEGKAHVAGQYTRYRADDTPIWSNQVTYVVTESAGGLGIRARFAAGFVIPEELREAPRRAALEIVEEYLAAFNARDLEAWAATLHYPHVRLAAGDLRVSQNAEEYMTGFDFDEFARRLGWDHTRWDSIEAIQVSENGVNLALRATRYDAEDRPIHSFDTLYLVTFEDGRWGIRARSSYAPATRLRPEALAR